jgi:hypothetical protein
LWLTFLLIAVELYFVMGIEHGVILAKSRILRRLIPDMQE